MPHVHVHQRRAEIQVFVAIGIPEIHALAFFNHKRVQLFLNGPAMHNMSAIQFLDGFFVQHLCTFFINHELWRAMTTSSHTGLAKP